jgi:transcriptional regulator with XRE-family HTH domain
MIKTLSYIRSTQNLTLADVARKIGISIGYLSHIETGRLKMTATVVQKLSKLYGITQKQLWECTESIKDERMLGQSWISHLKINGNPLPEAFSYHLQSMDRVNTRDHKAMKRELIEFVVKNIKPSLIAEMESNNKLIEVLLERVQPFKK